MENVPTVEKKTRKRKPSIKQARALANLVENGGNVSKAMRDAGYSPETAKVPAKLMGAVAVQEFIAAEFNDAELHEKHQELLRSTKIEHMVFPLGPKGEDDENFSGASPETEDDGSEDDEEAGFTPERTTLTDAEIISMLGEVNCKVRRIVHGNTARHVYYWAADNKARKDALEMAYKLKGKKGFGGDPKPGDVYNTVNIFAPDVQKKLTTFESEMRKTLGYGDTQKN